MTLHLHCKTVIEQHCHLVIYFAEDAAICLQKQPCIKAKFRSFGNIALGLTNLHCINVRKESSSNVDIFLLK